MRKSRSGEKTKSREEAEEEEKLETERPNNTQRGRHIPRRAESHATHFGAETNSGLPAQTVT